MENLQDLLLFYIPVSLAIPFVGIGLLALGEKLQGLLTSKSD